MDRLKLQDNGGHGCVNQVFALINLVKAYNKVDTEREVI